MSTVILRYRYEQRRNNVVLRQTFTLIPRYVPSNAVTTFKVAHCTRRSQRVATVNNVQVSYKSRIQLAVNNVQLYLHFNVSLYNLFHNYKHVD